MKRHNYRIEYSGHTRPAGAVSRHASDRAGATVVEFAVVTPVFFLLLFAGIEFATLGTIRSTANNAAYEAARRLVIPGAVASDGIDEAERIMGIVGVDSLTTTVVPSVISSATQQVTVNISVPYAENAVFVPLFTGGLTITSSITLRTERHDAGNSAP